MVPGGGMLDRFFLVVGHGMSCRNSFDFVNDGFDPVTGQLSRATNSKQRAHKQRRHKQYKSHERNDSDRRGEGNPASDAQRATAHDERVVGNLTRCVLVGYL